MQELEYNPCKKDLTDTKIHHLLAEELCQPYRRASLQHRRLSYSRHAVDDRDLTTQVNYKMHMNMRKTLGERKHHKRSKCLGKDGKPGHVSFPGITQNGSAKQFSHDYINEVLQENEDGELRVEEITLKTPLSGTEEDWDNGINFTAKSSPDDTPELSLLSHISNIPGLNPRKARLVRQFTKPPDYDDEPTVAEISLPWRRGSEGDEASEDVAGCSGNSDNPERVAKGAKGADSSRVTTPTATEAVLPWKRVGESDVNEPVKQNEFPPWSVNKEYLAYNSPSATFLGGIEQPKKTSVIGLFRRESTSSAHDSRAGSEASLHPFAATDSPTGTVLFIEEGPSSSTRRPQAGRRGSMLELGSSVNPIPEEETSLTEKRDLPRNSAQRLSLQNNITRLPALSPSETSSESSDSSFNEEEDELRAIHRTHCK